MSANEKAEDGERPERTERTEELGRTGKPVGPEGATGTSSRGDGGPVEPVARRGEGGEASAAASSAPRGRPDLRAERPWPWKGLVGEDVVIDTDSSFVYVGRLEGADEHFVALSTVDVHDMRDSKATKEVYVMEAAKYDVRANRRLVYVARSRILSVSLMADIVRY